jgi:diguanylate cyclase (GGDEF)-like protein/PAS domain S-box-containing protein
MYLYKDNLKRLVYVFLVFSIVLSSTHYYIEDMFFGNTAENIALDNAIKKTKEREKYFKDFLNQANDILVAISDIDEFKEYIKDRTNKKLIESIFVSYAKSTPYMMQLRYIDKNGHEKIRVDKNSTNIHIIPKDKLQDKSNRYYFKDSKKKPLQKVWYSKIDLNMEYGYFQIPRTPTIRAILPISKDGVFDGMLVINYNMRDFLKKFVSAPLYDMVLIDHDGYILYHHNKNRCWSYYAIPRYTLKKDSDYTKYFDSIVSSDLYKEEDFVSRRLDLGVDGGLYLILKLNQSYIQEQDRNSLERYVSVSILIFILSLILIFFVIKFLSRTLLSYDRIKELNEKLSIATHIARIGFWEYDAQDNSIEWSEGIYDIFDLEDKDEIITYDRFLSFLPRKDQESLQKEFAESIEQKRDYFITHKIITPKANIKYIEERAKHYYDNSGNHIRSVGSAYDITDRYLNEKKYKTIMDLALDEIFILDEDGKLLEYSDSTKNVLGYSTDEMSSLSVYDWDKSITVDEYKSIVLNLSSTPITIERVHTKKDGSDYISQILTKKIVLGGKSYIYASARDVTEQKRLQEEVTKERDFISTIVNNANAIIAVIKPDGTMSLLNRYGQQFTGYTQDEVASKPYFWDRFLDDSIKDKVLHIIDEAKKGNIVKSFQNSWKSKDGILKMFEWSNTLVTKPNGELDYIYTIGLDIDDKIKTQQIIQLQKDKLEAVFTTALEGICILDIDANYVDCNDRYCELTGYSKELLLGKRWFDMMSEECMPKAKSIFDSVLKYGIYENFERNYTDKDGNIKRLKSSAILMANKKEILLTTVDYTELYNAYKKIKKQSYTDELTQLNNRKAYNHRIKELLSEYQRYGNIFSYMMFDIDYFKSINDTYGHDMGDKVLVDLSALVSSSIRESDHIYRVGGEEFIILLSNTDLDSAKILAEKVRSKVEKELNSIDTRVVTISIGLVQVQKSDTVESIYKRADTLLYKAKESGRNRIES